MSNIVAHPETGNPAEEVVSYVELNREQLESEVNQKQSELDAATAALEAHTAQTAELTEAESKAEVALGEAKSKLGSYDELKPQPSDTPGEEGASSEVASTDEPGDSGDGLSGQPGDSGEGEVNVPVAVDPADEY